MFVQGSRRVRERVNVRERESERERKRWGSVRKGGQRGRKERKRMEEIGLCVYV